MQIHHYLFVIVQFDKTTDTPLESWDTLHFD